MYTYGSRSSRYSADHAGLALGERVRWLGVKTTDWFALVSFHPFSCTPARGSPLSGRAGVHHDDLLELTERDVQKVIYYLSLLTLGVC